MAGARADIIVIRKVPPHPSTKPIQAQEALTAALAQQQSLEALKARQAQEAFQAQLNQLAFKAQEEEKNANALAKTDPSRPNFRSLTGALDDAARIRSEALRLRNKFTEVVAAAKMAVDPSTLATFKTKAAQIASRLKSLQATLKAAGKAVAAIGSHNAGLEQGSGSTAPTAQTTTTPDRTTIQPDDPAARLAAEEQRKIENREAAAQAAKDQAEQNSKSTKKNPDKKDEEEENKKESKPAYSSLPIPAAYSGLPIPVDIGFQVSMAARRLTEQHTRLVMNGTNPLAPQAGFVGKSSL